MPLKKQTTLPITLRIDSLHLGHLTCIYFQTSLKKLTVDVKNSPTASGSVSVKNSTIPSSAGPNRGVINLVINPVTDLNISVRNGNTLSFMKGRRNFISTAPRAIPPRIFSSLTKKPLPSSFFSATTASFLAPKNLLKRSFQNFRTSVLYPSIRTGIPR